MPQGFTYGGNTILSHPIFVETILPFLLVFTIVFAILQKSKIFGENKRQIDAIVALVIGLLVISFGQATGIIVQLIPFLAVSLVVILVMMLLLGSFHKGELELPKGLKYTMWTLAVIAVVVAVLYITNAWRFLLDLIFITGGNNILINVVFIVLIVGAVIFVLWGAGKGSSSGKSEK